MAFSWRGANEMMKVLKKVSDTMPSKVKEALYLEAQIEMTEAKRRTPVAVPSWYLAQGYGKYRGTPGMLRASGRVSEPQQEGNRMYVILSFGTPYAIYVHEILDNHHEVGQAKYLESVLNESRPHMAARVAARLRSQSLVA